MAKFRSQIPHKEIKTKKKKRKKKKHALFSVDEKRKADAFLKYKAARPVLSNPFGICMAKLFFFYQPL